MLVKNTMDYGAVCLTFAYAFSLVSCYIEVLINLIMRLTQKCGH